MELGGRITLAAFQKGVQGKVLSVPQAVMDRLSKARDVVEDALASDAPVYGLNTGLGANLGHRIAPEDISGFQRQLISGRAVAVGPLLPPQTGRALLLARLVGAAQGHSGVSLKLFAYLCEVFRAGLAPAVPMYGSIGASDLTQNASWAMALLGQGQIWDGGRWVEAGQALAAAGLNPPDLQPKDGMALINHSAASVAVSAKALAEAAQGMQMCRHAAVMSFEGYGANPQIFAPEINALRSSPGQAEMADWFLRQITPDPAPRRVQDALCFRTLAPVMGAAKDALTRAIAVWESELNGASDSPAVLGTEAMCSTPNFHAPGLALALEQISLAMAMVAASSAMRMQRLMNPELTGLPRYLSPVGGASAGFVPLQKTAAALLADVRRHAMPVAFDPAPVSDGVEDMAPMTVQAALKVQAQMEPLQLLAGAEAMVAGQARELRGVDPTPLQKALRGSVAALNEDRAVGPDVMVARDVLAAFVGG